MMTSISSVSNAALLILQQPSSSSARSQPSGETDIVKVANGISSEPSDGMKSAAAVGGKFAVDSASAAQGKIVVAGLGSADSWEELKEKVRNDDSMTATEQEEWLKKLVQMQEMEASLEQAVTEFKESGAYALMRAGAIEAQSAGEAGTLDMTDAYTALDALSEKHGRSARFIVV